MRNPGPPCALCEAVREQSGCALLRCYGLALRLGTTSPFVLARGRRLEAFAHLYRGRDSNLLGCGAAVGISTRGTYNTVPIWNLPRNFTLETADTMENTTHPVATRWVSVSPSSDGLVVLILLLSLLVLVLVLLVCRNLANRTVVRSSRLGKLS